MLHCPLHILPLEKWKTCLKAWVRVEQTYCLDANRCVCVLSAIFVRQHHQGEHCRRGGSGEESGAEDRELFTAGRGAPH